MPNRTSTRPRVTKPNKPSDNNQPQPFLVWMENPTYLEDPKPWKCVGAFYYLTDCLEFIGRQQDLKATITFQSPADVRDYRPTDTRAVYNQHCWQATLPKEAKIAYSINEWKEPPKVGDRITYHGIDNTTVSGFIAERAESPLTLSPRYRVVDSMSEAKDPEAGKWVDVEATLGIFPPEEKDLLKQALAALQKCKDYLDNCLSIEQHYPIVYWPADIDQILEQGKHLLVADKPKEPDNVG